MDEKLVSVFTKLVAGLINPKFMPPIPIVLLLDSSTHFGSKIWQILGDLYPPGAIVTVVVT